MRSLSLRAAVATRMRLWDQIRRALRGPRQTQNLDLRPAHDPTVPRPPAESSTIAARSGKWCAFQSNKRGQVKGPASGIGTRRCTVVAQPCSRPIRNASYPKPQCCPHSVGSCQSGTCMTVGTNRQRAILLIAECRSRSGAAPPSILAPADIRNGGGPSLPTVAIASRIPG